MRLKHEHLTFILEWAVLVVMVMVGIYELFHLRPSPVLFYIWGLISAVFLIDLVSRGVMKLLSSGKYKGR